MGIESLTGTEGETEYPYHLLRIIQCMEKSGNATDAESLLLDYRRRGPVVLSELDALYRFDFDALTTQPRINPDQGTFPLA